MISATAVSDSDIQLRLVAEGTEAVLAEANDADRCCDWGKQLEQKQLMTTAITTNATTNAAACVGSESSTGSS
jgi:hypothetical protein